MAVDMRMGFSLRIVGGMDVLMMFVMHVPMLVRLRFMGVLVFVPF